MSEDQIISLVKAYPWQFAIAALIGFFRGVNKPIQPVIEILKKYVQSTETKTDDRILKKLEGSRVFIAFCFFVDLIFSIKISGSSSPPVAAGEKDAGGSSAN